MEKFTVGDHQFTPQITGQTVRLVVRRTFDPHNIGVYYVESVLTHLETGQAVVRYKIDNGTGNLHSRDYWETWSKGIAAVIRLMDGIHSHRQSIQTERREAQKNKERAVSQAVAELQGYIERQQGANNG